MNWINHKSIQSVVSIMTLLLIASCNTKQSVTVSIANHSDRDYGTRLIEVPLHSIRQRLKLTNASASNNHIVVLNKQGEKIPIQITMDSLLLFPVSLEANQQKQFTISSGEPTSEETIACGRVYPERLSDFAWENDKVAFRTYGPDLMAQGGISYGYDTFNKYGTSEPMLDEMYAGESNEKSLEKLRYLRTIDSKKAMEWASIFSYHYDHGHGYDSYSVDQTLGAGATALIVDGKLHFQNCWSKCTVLENGPLRMTAVLTFPKMVIKGDTVVEQRTITLDMGDHLNKTKVTYIGLKSISDVASGIVLHEDGTPETIAAGYGCTHAPLHSAREYGQYALDTKNRYMCYVDGTKGTDGSDIGDFYMGMISSEKCQEVARIPFSSDEVKLNHNRDFGHLLMNHKLTKDASLTYYWGTANQKDGEILNLASWKQWIENYVYFLDNPIEVSIN
ncbi:MAG: DUF4861 family protein [Bacteroidaceae bacterium]